MSSVFEAKVLDVIRKSNVGGAKVGIGPLSLRSDQSGNVDLAKAVIKLAESNAQGKTAGLNTVGKDLLRKVEELAKDSIMGSASEQKLGLQQLRVLKTMLPLVEDQTMDQKVAKSELIRLVNSTEKGLTKNTKFFNRFAEFARGAMPTLGGLVGGLASRSPLLGGIIAHALERHQEKKDAAKNAQKENIRSLLGTLEEIGEEKGSKFRRMPVSGGMDMDEQSAPMRMDSGADDATPGKDVLAKIDENTSATQKDVAKIRATLVREEGVAHENERNKERQAEAQTDALVELAEINKKQLLVQDKELKAVRQEGGGFGSSIMGALAGTKLGGALSSIGKIFTRIPFIGKFLAGGAALGGAGAIGKRMIGKLLSFPVQFVLAVGKGLIDGVGSLMKGEGFGTAAKKTLYGFADWFLLGQLDRIHDWLSSSRILDPVFETVRSIQETLRRPFVAIYDHVVALKDTIMKAVLHPIGALVGMFDSFKDRVHDMIQNVKDLVHDPKAFLANKLLDLKESIKKYFISMIPWWVPVASLPAGIREEVRKYRSGDTQTESQKKDANTVYEGQVGHGVGARGDTIHVLDGSQVRPPSASDAPGSGPISLRPASPKKVSAGGVGAQGSDKALLDLIASGESGKKGYDTVYGGSKVTPEQMFGKPLSELTIGEVKQWQHATVAAGSASSAAGRYQFIKKTLESTQQRLGLSDDAKFDNATQDKFALDLASQGPHGLTALRSGKASGDQFEDYIASQWASVKGSNGRGAYDGDGLNSGSTSGAAILKAAMSKQDELADNLTAATDQVQKSEDDAALNKQASAIGSSGQSSSSQTVNNVNSNTTVQQKSPINDDPTVRQFAPALG